MIVFHQSDVSFRRVVGGFLSHGRNLSAKELEQVVLPFAPFRGLTAYYLSVAARLLPDRTGPVGPPSEEGVTRSHPVQAGRKRRAPFSRAENGRRDGTVAWRPECRPRAPVGRKSS